MLTPPIPDNEMDRLISLSAFDLDYLTTENSFQDLAKLAARVAGTSLSMVNFIDAYTQWTVSNYGFENDQMPREDSVCQFTIMQPDSYEVKDLRSDERFNDKSYVTGTQNLGYYFGIPLKSPEGFNIGALCVLDQELRELGAEKVELLKIIGDEIVNRLKAFRVIEMLKGNLTEAKEAQKKVAHDIRGPLGGIIGLAQIISEQGKNNQIDEVLEFINLIHKSGNSLLDLADEILSSDKKPLHGNEFNLEVFKTKLDQLYMPQARNKNISFVVNIIPKNAHIGFSKNKLLQVAGNLISNALKFTPAGGKVVVDLSIKLESEVTKLNIKVSDTGVGLSKESIDIILSGTASSTNGTGGEKGYGFGLALVRHLIDKLNGTMDIYSIPGRGTTFEVNVPQL
jgi:signal transduction histidine kinase